MLQGVALFFEDFVKIETLSTHLNFNSTFILLVVLRRGITKLRELGAAVYLPLDKNIYFHKLAGRLIFIQGICHTCAHLTNYGTYKIVKVNPLSNQRLSFL